MSPSSCVLTSACTCQKTYWLTDFTSAQDKCKPTQTYFKCLAGVADLPCDRSTTVVVVAATHVVPGGCRDTCSCEISHEKSLAKGEDKCQAEKTFMACLMTSTGDTCTAGTHRVDLAKAFTVDTTCRDTCKCEIDYNKAVASNLDKCTEQKTFMTCLVTSTQDSCIVSTTAADVAAAFNVDAGCRDTCKCEVNYEKTLASGADKCLTQKTFMTCLEASSLDACTSGTPAHDLAQGFTIDPGCRDACICEIDFSKTVLTGTNVCVAQKALLECLSSSSADACASGTKSTTVAGTVVVDAKCRDTCVCEITYAKSRATEMEICTAQNTYMTCLTSATHDACATGKSAADIASSFSVDSSCRDACSCEVNYQKNVSSGGDKCMFKKTLLQCLSDSVQDGCTSGTTAQTVAGSVTVDSNCRDTCKCELHYEKSVARDEEKCKSRRAMMSCLRLATGISCTGGLSAAVTATQTNSAIDAVPSCRANLSDTCACEIAYAKNDITNASVKCSADRALVPCLRSANSPGCSGLTISTLAGSSKLGMSSASCSAHKTPTCDCELAYLESERNVNSHCSDGQKLYACVYEDNSTVTSCNGDLSTTLKTWAKSLVTTMTGCGLKDTCICEEMISANTSDCSNLLDGISCLSKANSNGCNLIKTIGTIAKDVSTKIAALSVCVLSKTCQCEINYTESNVSSDDKKCLASTSFKSCLQLAITGANGAHVTSCDGNMTATSLISTIADTEILATCGGVVCGVTYLLLIGAAVIFTLY